jgi:hypothetical protein
MINARGLALHPIYKRDETRPLKLGEKVDPKIVAAEESRFRLQQSMQRARDDAAERARADK